MATTRQARRSPRADPETLAGPEARQRLIIEGAADDPPIEQPRAFLAALRRALGDR
jgi:hypothetical protein